MIENFCGGVKNNRYNYICVTNYINQFINSHHNPELESEEKNHIKTTTLTIRISPEAKAKLEPICEQEHRSQSQQIEHWIAGYKLQRLEQDSKQNNPAF